MGLMKKVPTAHQVSIDDIFTTMRQYKEKIHRMYLDSISTAKSDSLIK
jgi:hypothetical protein